MAIEIDLDALYEPEGQAFLILEGEHVVLSDGIQADPELQLYLTPRIKGELMPMTLEFPSHEGSGTFDEDTGKDDGPEIERILKGFDGQIKPGSLIECQQKNGTIEQLLIGLCLTRLADPIHAAKAKVERGPNCVRVSVSFGQPKRMASFSLQYTLSLNEARKIFTID